MDHLDWAVDPTLSADWLDQQLARLQRLVDLQAAQAAHLNDNGRRLLQRAIFATYVECRDLGVAKAAQAVIVGGVPAVLSATPAIDGVSH